MEKVKLYGFWASPFSRRIEIALKMKGVEYEYVEEDLQNKSEELLKCNPIYKKIPVLVHDGKAIAESLVILEYIDEVWKDNQLLPSDPYERAQARFWAKFIDDKVFSQVKPAFATKGEESEKALKELDEIFKILESEIKGKKFFGGNDIGFLDITATLVALWIPLIQKAVGTAVLTREKYPGLSTWSDEILGCNVIKQNVPDKEKLQAFLGFFFANN